MRDYRWWLAALAALPVWAAAAWWRTPASFSGPTLAWCLSVFAYPLLEEIVFRGGLLGYLRQRPGMKQARLGISPANLVAATVFAAAHLWSHAPIWAAAVFIPGLVFGWCYERWGLRSAVAMHIWYNFGYFTLFPPSV